MDRSMNGWYWTAGKPNSLLGKKANTVTYTFTLVRFQLETNTFFARNTVYAVLTHFMLVQSATSWNFYFYYTTRPENLNSTTSNIIPITTTTTPGLSDGYALGILQVQDTSTRNYSHHLLVNFILLLMRYLCCLDLLHNFRKPPLNSSFSGQYYFTFDEKEDGSLSFQIFLELWLL